LVTWTNFVQRLPDIRIFFARTQALSTQLLRHRNGDAKYCEPVRGTISAVAKLAVAAARKARPNDILHHIAQYVPVR
jgi:hypothetical protein